jgi:TonB family protein
MRWRTWLVVSLASVVLLLVVHPITLLASDKAKQEGKELVDQAEAKANIFALPSFEIKATVRIDNKDKPLDGSYLLLWNGPEQWREEISVPTYSEVQVGGKGVVFLKRNTDFIPLRIDQLRSALGYSSGTPHPRSFIHVTPAPNETIKKIHDRKINGSKATCVEFVESHENHTREVCVDKATGALVRQPPFLDREMMAVGGKVFPRFLSYVENGKPLAEIQISELKTTERLPSSAFEPPNGSVSKPGCMNPSPGRLAKRVMPQHPEQERRSHAEGTVAIYAQIAHDGVPRQFRIVSGLTQGLNNASLDAVQQWRYEPATCNGIPVDVETVITVNYSLTP